MPRMIIDGREVEFSGGASILEVARDQGIEIPTLCYHQKLTPYGGCRVCLVEAGRNGAGGTSGGGPKPANQAGGISGGGPKPAIPSNLVPACITAAEKGLVVSTDTERVKRARAFVIALLLSRSPESTELQELGLKLGVSRETRETLDVVGRYLLCRAPRLEDTRCIRCGLCVRVCAEITERHAISFSGRGIARKVKTPFDKVATSCIGCGSCAYVCPTDTITVEEAP